MTAPKVSIGLPVYNGEDYVGRAIESALAQDFDDFELLISDNGSTDATEEICRKYADADPRLRYVRHETNRGATWNFNSIFTLASGEYYCWLASDDMWAPDYLSGCVATLDTRPDVVVCFSHVTFVDELDQPVDEMNFTMRTWSSMVGKRFYDVLMVWHDCLPIFGLMRTAELASTPLIGPYSSGDHVLLARLALMGKYHILDGHRFLSRRHPRQSNKMYNVWVDHHAYSEWFEQSGGTKVFLPQWRLLRDYVAMALRARTGVRQGVRCLLAVGRWAIRYRLLLARDLTLTGRKLLRRRG